MIINDNNSSSDDAYKPSPLTRIASLTLFGTSSGGRNNATSSNFSNNSIAVIRVKNTGHNDRNTNNI